MTRSRCSNRSAPRREPLRSRPPLVHDETARTSTPLNARLHADAGQPKYRTAAPPAALHWAVLVSPACSRASDGQVQRWVAPVTSQTRERSGSLRRAMPDGCFRAPLFAAPRSCAVQGLFFGDFLLAPQKKVTPPPGGTPGNAPSRRSLPESNQTRLQYRSRAANRTSCSNCLAAGDIRCPSRVMIPNASMWHGNSIGKIESTFSDA